MSFESVAEFFVQSAEVKAMYGANANNKTVLTKIYEFALHRQPDNVGFVWCLDVLASRKPALAPCWPASAKAMKTMPK